MVRDMRFFRKVLREFVRKCGFVVIPTRRDTHIKEDLANFDGLLDQLLIQAGVPLAASRAQLKQDIAALACNGFKRNGYFVDIGAAEPVNSSNTVMLEREFGWHGICCEANPNYRAALLANRDCVVDSRCVWTNTGETLPFHFAHTLATLSEFVGSDHHAKARRDADVGMVETVSLNDVLTTHGAPRHIDFLSIDTEGSELAILEGFDFSAASFGFICVEHNYAANRIAIKDLLESKGYRRIWTRLSKWDDWYVPDQPVKQKVDGRLILAPRGL